MMSFGAFSFFYLFVFAWGGVGMLFIAVVVIREMLQIGKHTAHADHLKAEETVLPETEEPVTPVGKSPVV